MIKIIQLVVILLILTIWVYTLVRLSRKLKEDKEKDDDNIVIIKKKSNK